MDDGVFVFDKDSEDACKFTLSVWTSLRAWFGCSMREPQPGERAGFDIKPANTVLIVTPNFLANEQVIEALEAAATSKRNIVLLHHIRSS